MAPRESPGRKGMKRMFKRIVSILLALSLCIVCAAPVSADGNPLEVVSDEAVPTAADVADIPAKSALLMDASSGRVLFEKNADEPMPPASITKIMTLLLVFEAIDKGELSYSDIITCSENANSMGGTQIWLEVGEQMSAEDLIKATAINSANDAAMVLAEHVGGSEMAFVEMMNQKAKDLGMVNTHFVNPTGLDAEGHVSTARDIALMSRELLKHKDITKFSTVWMDSLRDGKTGLTNTNKLVRFYKGCTGLKTGTTDGAGSCLSATAERNGLSLVAVSMGSTTSDERFSSCRTMLDYGFSAFEHFTPEILPEDLTPVAIIKGVEKQVELSYETPEPILIPKGRSGDIEKTMAIQPDVEAPVLQGQAVGEARFTLDGETICEIPIVAAKEVQEMTFGNAFQILLRNLLTF